MSAILNQLKYVIFYLFIATFIYSGVGEWTSNGPWKGRVNGLAINPKNPDILYVAHQTIYKTTDAGKTWNLSNNGIPWDRKCMNCGIWVVPTQSDILFAGG